jgi:hypothetical protein
MVDGDREPFLVEDGDAGSDEWPGESRAALLLLVASLGLSLPVGPFPRGGRLAGGRLRATRRQPFSSSSSATLCSNAWIYKDSASIIQI